MKKMTNQTNLLIGVALLFFPVAFALFSEALAPESVGHIDLFRELEKPGTGSVLGRDANGIDLLSLIIVGSRVSLGVAVSVTFLTATLGLMLGSLAGIYGKGIDVLVMRVTDTVLAFPGLLLAISIAAVMEPGISNVVFALALTGWAGYARLVRGEILSIREKEYIQSARSLGAGNLRIWFHHILPNLIPVLLVQMTFGLAGVVIAESSLSFLGIGAPAGTPSWGALLSQGKEFLLEGSHVSTFSGIAIMIVVLGFNFLGDGLRDILDPRERI